MKTLNPILGLRVPQVGKGTADKGSGRGTSSGVVGVPADAAEPVEDAGEVGLADESDADSLVGSADSSAGSEHSTAAPAPTPATKGGGRGRGKGRGRGVPAAAAAAAPAKGRGRGRAHASLASIGSARAPVWTTGATTRCDLRSMQRAAVLPPSRRCLAASRCGHCCPRVPSALLPRATHHLHLLTTARRREQGKGGTHADLLSRLLRPVKHAQRELTSGLLEPLAWPLWLVRVVVSLLGISWSSVTRVHVKIPRSVVTYQVRIKVALHSTYVLRSLFTALTYYVVTPLENRQSRQSVLRRLFRSGTARRSVNVGVKARVRTSTILV